MINIAHRVKTIMGCNRVITMKAGQIVEIGDPFQLAKDPKSHFGELVSHSKIHV